MHSISHPLLDIISDIHYINEDFHEDGVTPEPSAKVIQLIDFLGHFITFCNTLPVDVEIPEYVSLALTGVAESFVSIDVGTIGQRSLLMQKRFQLLTIVKGFGADVNPTLPQQFWPEAWQGNAPEGVSL